MNKPRIAASSYLNAAPLCYSFVRGEQRDRCEFLADASPAWCSELLAGGAVDVALIPVIEYQRISSLSVVPGACVGSRKSVRSVVLASKVPISEIRSVALDTSSRTSAALVRIILSRFYALSPSYRALRPRIAEMLDLDDAALIIGDPAMLIDRSTLHVYDLAEEWRKHTGLPFVFAFWGVRGKQITRLGGVDFGAAKREGIGKIEEIARDYSAELGLPEQDLRRYLSENISYDLDEESLCGLRLYYDLARDCGLIDYVRELDFDS